MKILVGKISLVRLQQLVQVEIPAAATQIMIGVNQALMAALSMVIIAAVIAHLSVLWRKSPNSAAAALDVGPTGSFYPQFRF